MWKLCLNTLSHFLLLSMFNSTTGHVEINIGKIIGTVDIHPRMHAHTHRVQEGLDKLLKWENVREKPH